MEISRPSNFALVVRFINGIINNNTRSRDWVQDKSWILSSRAITIVQTRQRSRTATSKEVSMGHEESLNSSSLVMERRHNDSIEIGVPFKMAPRQQEVAEQTKKNTIVQTYEHKIHYDTNWMKAEHIAALALVLITFTSFPFSGGIRSGNYVWWCGWLTAISTGFGAVPFFWVKHIEKFWLGVCNGTVLLFLCYNAHDGVCVAKRSIGCRNDDCCHELLTIRRFPCEES